MKEKILKYKYFDLIYSIVYVCTLYFFSHLIALDNMQQSIEIIGYVIENFSNCFIIGFLITFSIFLIINAIIKNNLRTNIILTSITLIISIISYYKFIILENPFVPSDILLIGNINQIGKFGITLIPIQNILLMLSLILLLVLQYLFKKEYYKEEQNERKMYLLRIIVFLLGIAMLYNICISPNRFSKLGIKNDMRTNYYYMAGNGAFFMHLGDFYTIKPEGYNEENIEKIKQENKVEIVEIQKEHPNVIMIMNESFSNPNKIKNVKYSVNPIKNIEELKENDKNCIIGNTVVPVLGGGTALPEYEALTGLSSYFIEKQIQPYTSYIRSNMNSVVRTYKNNGYTTVGIHTNTQTFYNRNYIYDYLGFEQTVFAQDISKPIKKGGNISDEEFEKQVISKFEENDGKKFIFGLTMQNHMPYLSKKYNQYDIDVKSNSLDENEVKELRNYVQGVYDADKMYINIVNYLKNVEEPTVLVMFGDHLPALSQYSVYKESGYSKLEYYSTPYVIWANYDINYKEIFSEYMSPSNLSISIMKLLDIELPWYLKVFDALYEKFPVINNQLIIDKDCKMIDLEEAIDYNLVNDCRIIQYDLLINKKYIPVE